MSSRYVPAMNDLQFLQLPSIITQIARMEERQQSAAFSVEPTQMIFHAIA